MKTTKRVTVTTLALISIILLASSFVIPPPLATADPAAGTILWKSECPWRAEISIQQVGRDLVVFCSTSR